MNTFSSENFLNMAINFCNSSSVLQENIDHIRPMPFASIFFCTGHSIELSLKGFLISQGKNESEIKDYGHDLEKILAVCKKYNFSLSLEDDAAIKTLNKFYKNHDFRYPNTWDMDLPNHKWVTSIAKNICDLVKGKITQVEVSKC